MSCVALAAILVVDLSFFQSCYSKGGSRSGIWDFCVLIRITAYICGCYCCLVTCCTMETKLAQKPTSSYLVITLLLGRQSCFCMCFHQKLGFLLHQKTQGHPFIPCHLCSLPPCWRWGLHLEMFAVFLLIPLLSRSLYVPSSFWAKVRGPKIRKLMLEHTFCAYYLIISQLSSACEESLRSAV